MQDIISKIRKSIYIEGSYQPIICQMKNLIPYLTTGIILIITSSFNTVREEGLANGSSDTPAALNVEGLYFAEFYDYIYRGHFEHVDITREDTQFLMIFEQYLRTFGKQCPDYLPEDKVEIMEQVCATEEVTRNIYGDELSRVCVEWEWVGTGLFARPDLYSAKMEVEGIQRAKGLQTVMSMVMDPNAMGNSVDMIHKSKGLKNDMAQFFVLNACKSAAVLQFEENLKLFARKQPAIRMEESSKFAKMKKSGGPSGSQDFAKLIDDLVADQAKTWAFNKYNKGSISDVNILSSDGNGRPAAIRANYRYSGFGNSNGWVKITFTNGLPECIYFFDFPDNCKNPNSSIVASYAQGNYGM